MAESNAIIIVESLLRSNGANEGLNDLQSLIFEKAWDGYTYQQIADEVGYDHDYVKHVASQLWKLLSKASGETVSKRNIRSVLRRFQCAQSLPLVSASTSAKLTSQPLQGLCSTEGQEIRWVGRESLVGKLADRLLANIRVLSLVGITGIGKSSLAIRLTLEPKISQRWNQVRVIRCDQQDHIFEQMARKLLGDQVIQNEEFQKSPEQLTYAIISHLQLDPTLVLLDMLEEVLTINEGGFYQYAEPQFEFFFEQLVKAEDMSSRFILTSQHQPPLIANGRYDIYSHLVRLSGLTQNEALSLFHLWNVAPTSETDLGYLSRFAKAYEGHPLALQTIAGEIREQPYEGNIPAYWYDYGSEIEALEQTQSASTQKARKDELNLSNYSINLIDLVEQRIEQSFKRLQECQPIAYELLCMGSVFRCSVEREGWLFLIGDAQKRTQLTAFQSLQRRFLIEEDLNETKVLYRLHSLIRSVALHHLDELDSESLT